MTRGCAMGTSLREMQRERERAQQRSSGRALIKGPGDCAVVHLILLIIHQGGGVESYLFI